MDFMFIFYPQPAMQGSFGRTNVIFCKDDDSYLNAENSRDVLLGRGRYKETNPVMEKVELFARRSTLEGSGDNKNDYVFINEWTA